MTTFDDNRRQVSVFPTLSARIKGLRRKIGTVPTTPRAVIRQLRHCRAGARGISL
jgi:hypothetical protein